MGRASSRQAARLVTTLGSFGIAAAASGFATQVQTLIGSPSCRWDPVGPPADRTPTRILWQVRSPQLDNFFVPTNSSDAPRRTFRTGWTTYEHELEWPTVTRVRS